jgi:hypothetical protein
MKRIVLRSAYALATLAVLVIASGATRKWH